MLERLREENEEVAIRTGVAPLTFNPDGTYTTNYPVGQRKYDADGNVISDSDYLNRLFNLDVKGKIDVSVAGGNNFVYKNGKPYIQGYYTFDENTGDKLFDPESSFPSVIGTFGWVEELSDELGLVEKVKDTAWFTDADDDNIYRLPVLIPLSGQEFNAAMEGVDQEMMGLEGKETQEQRKARQDKRKAAIKSADNDAILENISAVRDNTKQLVTNHLEMQGINNWPATNAPGYAQKAKLFMQNSDMSAATKNEINSFIEANTDANGKLTSGANVDQMADFFTEVVIFNQRLTSQLSDPSFDEPEKKELQKMYSNAFVNKFNALTGKDITSATAEDVKSFGLSHT